MKTFKNAKGHTAGTTATVGEIIEALQKYPSDTPVFAELEGVCAPVYPAKFEIAPFDNGNPDDACECLFIDVNEY